MAEVTTDSMSKLLAIMARLRAPNGGCPWDLEQNFSTVAPYTIEEAYEVADAIERGDMADLCDELGDLLFQVVFHARMAEEAGSFDFEAVAAGICEKMVRRHPHVFEPVRGPRPESEAPASSPQIGRVIDATEQTHNWEAIKAAERAATAGPAVASELDGVAVGLPALQKAQKLQRRAARVGFDWESLSPVVEKLREELWELQQVIEAAESPQRVDEELGDLLFAAVNVARHAGVEPDGALRRANAKFEKRFRCMEQAARERGTTVADIGADGREALWEAAKASDR